LQREGTVQAETFPKDHRQLGLARKPARRRALSGQAHHCAAQRFAQSLKPFLQVGTVNYRGGNSKSYAGRRHIGADGKSDHYILVGAQHRIENSGRIPSVFIEVQIGPYIRKMTSSVMRIAIRGRDHGRQP
jgi:mannose-1-phosphate guanylyltransferase/mannose-6-phosphate isomerase